VVSTTAQPALVERTWKRVQEEVSKGHQVYVVCPRISTTASDEEVSDGNNLATVEDVAAQLQTGPLFGLRIAQLHGRLPSDEKESIMQKFNQGEIDVLVSTTVIEVGVDVPNASTMVIMDADRFGVSQLHQLRGRVGRGSVAGLCLLLSSVDMESSSWQRLQSVAATLDGFELSRIDLEQRREGDVLGAMQSGRRSSLKVLNVLRDEETISQARQAAQEVILHNPHLEGLPQLTMRINAILQQERSEYLEKA
jgi:ATP-dependent DNA helicase RecG